MTVHRLGRARRFDKALDAAESASGRAGKYSTSGRIPRHGYLRNPHSQLYPEIAVDDLNLGYVTRILNNTLGKAQSDRKILQIGRRRHHDGVGMGVIGERNRGLFRDEPFFGQKPPGTSSHASRTGDRNPRTEYDNVCNTHGCTDANGRPRPHSSQDRTTSYATIAAVCAALRCSA